MKVETEKMKQREKEIALEMEQAKRNHVQRVPLDGFTSALSPPDSPASEDNDVEGAPGDQAVVLDEETQVQSPASVWRS
jgi:hypothetical protein